MLVKQILITLSIIQLALADVGEWGQCGGRDYTGDKKCSLGLTCVYINEFYSQCQKSTSVTGITTPRPVVTVTQSSTASSTGTFYVNNKKIYDANGKEFLIRGVNNAHADWDNYNRFWALKSLGKISELKANTVRVQWKMKHSNGDLNLSHLENIIVTAKNNGLVSIIELHDSTDNNDPNMVKSCAQWFANNISLFQKYKRYLMINVANEWSKYGFPGDRNCIKKWRNAYISAIDIIRGSGWQGVIIIDAPAFAQDPNSVITYGPQILNHDKVNKKNGNIVFSLHTYVQWKINGDYKFRQHLTKIHDIGLPVMIGEFADQHPEHPTCQWVNIDIQELMSVCKERSIGYLGWSWAGNGFDCNQDLSRLNLVQGNQQQESTWTQGVLSSWGTKLFKAANVGIQATSIKASIF